MRLFEFGSPVGAACWYPRVNPEKMEKKQISPEGAIYIIPGNSREDGKEAN
jgi:hypothetical protein